MIAPVVASIGYRFGRFELQPDERRLLANGTPVHLRPHAFDLLVALVERSGRLVTKDELLERVWRKVVVEENTLQAHISALRKVLGASAIATVSGSGYRFTLEVGQFGARTQAAAPAKHNLPHDLTSFIGREKQITDLAQLLQGTRLLTLTGSGGCGKTRLAIQLAKQRAPAHADGAWFVELAALTDAALLPQTVAAVLGIKESTAMTLRDAIAGHLASRSVLLVLDNAEHLIDACAEFAESLLRRCERLVILVTSRERLGITGELIYRVPSLSVPDAESDSTPEAIAAYESARLLIDRARSQYPQFAVTPQNAPALASICRRLDGIALALELAAPRLRILSVEDLSRHLDQRFELLTEGSRTALPRHRTLRGLINWSYDLLDSAEKAMFRSVSVFAGGWTLDAAEQVSSEAGSRVLDLLTSLADKSLITVETPDGSQRYGMLETVRDYALDRLREAGEQAQAQERHLAFFLALAEEANRHRSDASAAAWLDRIEIERDNLRSALSWSIETHVDGAGLRLASAQYWFWLVRGHLTEGRRSLSAALAGDRGSSDRGARSMALRSASVLAQRQGDYFAARRAAEEALAICTEAGDRHGIAVSWQLLGAVSHNEADHGRARECYERSLALLRELDDEVGSAVVLGSLGEIAIEERHYEDARAALEESVGFLRARGDWRLPHQLTGLAIATHYLGDAERARSMLTEALARFRERGDREGMAYALVNLAEVADDRGDHSDARSSLAEALVIEREIGNPRLAAIVLGICGDVASHLASPWAAARLWGRALRVHEELGSNVTLIRRHDRERDIAASRAALGEDAFQAAWDEGRAMTLDQAADFALRSMKATSQVPPTVDS